MSTRKTARLSAVIIGVCLGTMFAYLVWSTFGLRDSSEKQDCSKILG